MFSLLPLCLTFCKCLGSGCGTKNWIIFTLLIYLAAEGRILEVETLQKGNESENENTSGQRDKSHGNICFFFCLCLGVVFAFCSSWLSKCFREIFSLEIQILSFESLICCKSRYPGWDIKKGSVYWEFPVREKLKLHSKLTFQNFLFSTTAKLFLSLPIFTTSDDTKVNFYELRL